MNTLRPVSRAAFRAAKRTVHGFLADALAVFTLGIIFGFLMWGPR